MAPLDLQAIPEYSEVPMEARISYWIHFALGKHRNEMDFVLHTAKLRRKHDPSTWRGWNNVMKHNVAQSGAMGALCESMGIDANESERLETYAFVHNPTICRDVFRRKQWADKPIPETERFTAEEEAKLEREYAAIMETVDPDGALRIATSPEFFDRIAMQEGETIEEKAMQMPFSDLLVYYVDALFDDGNLLPAHERIAKMEQRRPDLNADDARTARLGMRYWDAERKVSTEIQMSVFKWLKTNGIGLASPEDVPEFIRKRVGQKMMHAA